MMARNFDERVGFDTRRPAWTSAPTSIARCASASSTRFRLEKKDPNAAVSEPVKPIVFYIDPGDAGEVGAVREARHRVLAAGVRSGGLPERDRRARRADERSGVERRGRALFRRPLGADARPRAQSIINDPRSGEILSAAVDVYPNVQTLRTDLVLRPGRRRSTSARSSCRCPTSSWASSSASRWRIRSATRSACRTTSRPARLYTVAQVRDPKWVKENGLRRRRSWTTRGSTTWRSRRTASTRPT